MRDARAAPLAHTWVQLVMGAWAAGACILLPSWGACDAVMKPDPRTPEQKHRKGVSCCLLLLPPQVLVDALSQLLCSNAGSAFAAPVLDFITGGPSWRGVGAGARRGGSGGRCEGWQ